MVSGALRRHKSKSPMCVDRVKRNEPFPTSLSDPKIKDKKVWTDSEPIPKDIPTHLRFDNDMIRFSIAVTESLGSATNFDVPVSCKFSISRG